MSNLSSLKRQEMLNYIEQLKEIHKDDDSIVALNNIANALTEKKYGLVWEEHTESIDEILKEYVPVFTEVKENEIYSRINDGCNFLLEGDNLHSLKLLEKTHKNKIDVIYIDPPYNTKNKDFIYNDTRIGIDDGFRHSKWISFMEKRLTQAKKLLTEDGVIFINIDENEVHQLKMLCDEIFGEANFVGEFIWKARSGKGGTTSLISIEHESILCYGKNKLATNFYMDVRVSDKDKTEQLRQWGQAVHRKDRPTMFFPIFHKEKNNEWTLPSKKELENLYDSNSQTFNDDYLDKLINKYKEDGWSPILPIVNNEYGRWRRGYDGINLLINENLLVNDKGVAKRIIPGGNITKTAVSSILPDTVGTSATGTKEIKKLFDNKKVFDTTKPKSLIMYLINLAVFNKKSASVLDYFAGSGTTGHAVLELNKKDNGNRKYILCTNNENKICEKITYQRLKKLQDEFPHNLKYFKTDFVKKFNEEENLLSSHLLLHIKEMVELENMCRIDGENKVLILSSDELDNWFKNNIKEKATVYLPSYILLSREIEVEAKKKEIQFIDVPDYYFLDELREVNEL